MKSDKVFFVIGIRRSGTSILRTLLSKSEEIGTILFEPHDLYHSIQMLHFKRFDRPAHRQRVENFAATEDGQLIGAKIALNPGIDALDWIWLTKEFPAARFIFIIRNEDDTFMSYAEADGESVRGIVPQHTYSPMFQWLQGWIWNFADKNPTRAIILRYEELIEDPDKALAPAWKLLDIKPVTGLKDHIKEPEHTNGAAGE